MQVVTYIPQPTDICGRCTLRTPVARVLYESGWVINVCADCLTIDEVDANLNDCS